MHYFGHTHPAYPQDPTRWESLSAHLNEVADRAAAYGQKFDSAELTRTLGLWHDLGKFSQAFQRYLRHSGGDTEEGEPGGKSGRGPDHSTAGARHAAIHCRPGLGQLLGYALAGHHAGLPDGDGIGPGTLKHRLSASPIEPWEEGARATLDAPVFRAPALEKKQARFLADGYASSFWTRMLFSCLVDADFLATEAFMNAEQGRIREETERPSLTTLAERLQRYMEKKRVEAADSPVNRIRTEIRDACLREATEATGLFSMSVPTGGGKTLSSLAFALEHARRHGLERIVYVIPFTGIIEQNATVFREALGDEAILEHHSNFDGEPNEDAPPDERLQSWKNKLASENWDAPVIVTTGVQFFESLHAHKPSRCRKLHRLSRSVIILDEAQTLPLPLLQPCLRALEQLAKNYGSTVVLCTATQPAVHRRENFPVGLENLREIIPTSLRLHERLRRVVVERLTTPLTDDALTERLLNEPRVLCIVNTRKHARVLFEKLRAAAGESHADNRIDRSVHHLSAQMCPVHRTEVLDEVRAKLRAGKSVRLISTQLIEAGVDIDFPCVHRTCAGLDAIAQAAGRCNREGRLGDPGRVIVFTSADHRTPAGYLRQTAESGDEVLLSEHDAADPLEPAAIERYFRLLYGRNFNADATRDRTNFVKVDGAPRNILGDLLPSAAPRSVDEMLAFRLRTLGENFRLIEDTTEALIVPYGEEGRRLGEKLRETYDPAGRRRLLRQLQRYTVAIPKPVFAAALADGRIQKIQELAPVLVSPGIHYSPDLGVTLDSTAPVGDLIF